MADYSGSDPLLDSNGVATEAGGKSKMTIWRWQRDPNVGFPMPDVVINGRNYWYRSTIRRWQSAMAAKPSKRATPPRHIEHAIAN